MSGFSCKDVVCGTGGGNFPKPGDPDSNVILKATPAFGGIDVEWTYPNINPHAVAHTILYRSTSGNVSNAVRHAVVSGNFFYDKSTSTSLIKYFYWIQIVSVNGTYSEMIGPASATAKPAIEQMIELLTGQIDAGVLAQSLKTEIGKIQLNKMAVDKELLALAEQDDALGAAYNEVVAFTENTRALLQQETLARADANSAFATNINTLYADMQDVVAAVQVETDARVTADKSLASQITTTQSQLRDQIASVQVGMQTKIDTVNGKVTEIGALYTAKVDVNGLIGGFGVYNNGKTVEAGFDVDRFWIGRTQNKRKPFIIENNEVFISEAVINKLTFNKLRDESGSFIVQNGKVKADYLTVDTASIRDASITDAKIANGAITTAKIADASIGSAKIQNAAIDSAKIRTASIDTLHLAEGAVTVNRFVEAYDKVYIGEHEQRTILSVPVTVVNGSNVVEVEFTLGLGSDRGKNSWPVEVRLYRNGTIVWSRAGTVGTFLDNSVPRNSSSDLLRLWDPNLGDRGDWGGTISIDELGGSPGSWRYVDYNVGAGNYTYSLWVWIQSASTTPYTWYRTRRLIARGFKR